MVSVILWVVTVVLGGQCGSVGGQGGTGWSVRYCGLVSVVVWG